MKKTLIAFGILCFANTLSGCGELQKQEKLNDKDKPEANQKIGKILPFKVCNIQNNRGFNNGFSVVDADIKVDGGNSNDWVATGIAIAKKLGDLGISTDVKLTIYRSDLGVLDDDRTPNGFKWLTQIDYGVDPNHSINTSDGGKQWLISYATDSTVATPKDIKIDRDYQNLVEKYKNPQDDDKIAYIIKKKYNIIGEFNLPPMNISKNTNNPSDYFIDMPTNDNSLKIFQDRFKELLRDGALRDVDCSV